MLYEQIAEQLEQFIDTNELEISCDEGDLSKLLPFNRTALPPTDFFALKANGKMIYGNTSSQNAACAADDVLEEKSNESADNLEHTASTTSSDLAAIYLREIHLQSTPQHTVELQARQCLEECERHIAQVVLHSPLVIREIISLGRKLQANTISIREIARTISEETAEWKVDLYRDKVLALIRHINQAEQKKRTLYRKMIRCQLSGLERATLQKKIDYYTTQQIALLQQIDLSNTFISTVVLKLKYNYKQLQKIQDETIQGSRKIKLCSNTSTCDTATLRQTIEIIEGEERKIQKARNLLVNAYLGLVVGWAKRYTNRGLDFLDLVQEGNIGLIKAANKFDTSKNYKFSSHASWWIRQAITRAIANQGQTIRIPAYLTEIMSRFTKISNHLFRENGRELTPEEIEAMLGFSPDKLQHVKDMQKLVSLEKPLKEEENGCLKDIIEDKRNVFPGDIVDSGSLLKMMEILTPREKKVLSMRFGIGDELDHTLEEVGQVLSLTRQRIKQIEGNALRKLRKAHNNHFVRCP